MTTNYDPIAEQYKRSKQQPWRTFVECFTLMELLGDPRGQAVLEFDSSGKFVKRLDLRRFWPVQRIRLRYFMREARIWLGERSPSYKLGRVLLRNVVAARPVFVRGLCRTPAGTILVGISPATILEFNWNTGRLVDSFSYSNDVNVAVHGLACRSAS